MNNIAKSPLIFPALVALSLLLLFHLNGDEIIATDNVTRLIFTLLVIIIWVIGLCLHEFSHAYSSYMFGDDSIGNKGYLTLNPLLYGDVVSSVIIPVIVLMVGGLPLPGGAVYLNHSKLPTKNHIALTFFAGPLANMAFGVLLCLIYFWFKTFEHNPIIDAVIVLSAFLQFYTFVFNMLPLPGFDGFGIASTYMQPETRAKMMRASGLVLIALMASIFIFPQVFFIIQLPALYIANAFGLDLQYLVKGFEIFLGGVN